MNVMSADLKGFDIRTEKMDLLEQIGADGHQLLDAIYRADMIGLRQLPAVECLRRVWLQQFYVEQENVRFRQSGNHPAARDLIYSPYDLDARLGVKRETA